MTSPRRSPADWAGPAGETPAIADPAVDPDARMPSHGRGGRAGRPVRTMASRAGARRSIGIARWPAGSRSETTPTSAPSESTSAAPPKAGWCGATKHRAIEQVLPVGDERPHPRHADQDAHRGARGAHADDRHRLAGRERRGLAQLGGGVRRPGRIEADQREPALEVVPDDPRRRAAPVLERHVDPRGVQDEVAHRHGEPVGVDDGRRAAALLAERGRRGPIRRDEGLEADDRARTRVTADGRRRPRRPAPGAAPRRAARPRRRPRRARARAPRRRGARREPGADASRRHRARPAGGGAVPA